MKKHILIAGFVLITGLSFGTTVTITNSGFTFSPDDVTINFGDVVEFQLASIHNAVEVSETTWLANGNTPLSGGFSLPLGGGQVSDLTPGIHYYVCAPHASGGMKGKITVNAPSGIGDNENGNQAFNLHPNPTTGKFVFSIKEDGPIAKNDNSVNISIYDLLGKKVIDLKEMSVDKQIDIDLSDAPDGLYFVRIDENRATYTRRLLKY